MPITLRCQCRKEFKVKDEFAGQKIKCPGCGRIMQAEMQPQAAQPEDDLASIARSAREANRQRATTPEPPRPVPHWVRPAYILVALLTAVGDALLGSLLLSAAARDFNEPVYYAIGAMLFGASLLFLLAAGFARFGRDSSLITMLAVALGTMALATHLAFIVDKGRVGENIADSFVFAMEFMLFLLSPCFIVLAFKVRPKAEDDA